MRMHVVLPDDLMKAVDALAGKGKRSRFIEDAVREKLRIEALIAALKVKHEKPNATITYARKRNKRGDLRHPHHDITEKSE